MKVVVKPRFNTQKQSIERYSEGMYLMHLPFPEDPSAADIMVSLLSKSMGVPPHRINFVAVDARKNWVFEI